MRRCQEIWLFLGAEASRHLAFRAERAYVAAVSWFPLGPIPCRKLHRPAGASARERPVESPMSYNINFSDRQKAAAEAKKAMMAKFKPKPAVQDPNFVSREAEKQAELERVRAERAEARAAAKIAAAAAEAARRAARAELEANDLESQRAARRERKAMAKADQRAARDARYAAFRMNKGSSAQTEA